MSCTPTGSPPSLTCSGSEIAGWPAKFQGIVNGPRSSDRPEPRSGGTIGIVGVTSTSLPSAHHAAASRVQRCTSSTSAMNDGELSDLPASAANHVVGSTSPAPIVMPSRSPHRSRSRAMTVAKMPAAVGGIVSSAGNGVCSTVWPSESSEATARSTARTQSAPGASPPGIAVRHPMRSRPGSAPTSSANGRLGGGAV